jgi:Cytochrome c7 and related cytochrome c
VVTTWRIARFDHTQTNEPCETCHDRLHASGKPFVHIRASNDCGSCHKTQAWTLGTFDHTGVVDGCFKCHDGVTATGKSGSHLTTSNGCESCHNTVAWAKVKFDHSDPLVAGVSCLNCHDGRRATGRAVTHYKTAADCDGCHTTTKWAPAKFDHGLALDPTDCASCHRAVPNEHLTTKGTAHGKPLNHIKSSDLCADCHHSVTSWAGAVFSHDNIVGGCVDCHDGTIATGRSTSHLNTTTECAACHDTVKWQPAAFDHTYAVNNANCFACHDGAHTTSKGHGVGKNATHVQPSSNTCTFCHAADNFTTWKGAAFVHPNVFTNCQSCHEGTIATGKNLTHLITSDRCETCHNIGTTFKPAKMPFDHAETSATCISCHNGTTNIATGPVKGKLQGPSGKHFQTTDNCDACHNSSTFIPATFDHNETNATCISCHGGPLGTSTQNPLKSKASVPGGKKHVASPDDCSACHSTNTWTTMIFDHSVVAGMPCATCHDGLSATGKSVNHLAEKAPDCANCHTSFTAWTAVAFDHTVVSTSCFTCHNGTFANSKGALRTKGANHLPTGTKNCEDCHTSTVVWKVPFNHANIGTSTCESCHNGTIATGKLSISGNHVTTPNTCISCHITSSWTAVSFDHSIVSPVCADCHNGTTAISSGKLTSKIANHIPTGAQGCESCHTSFSTWKVIFNHANVVAGTCFTCHDGKVATGKLTVTGKHFATSNTCDNCHTTTTVWKPVASVNIHADTTVSGAACKSCHDGVVATGKFSLSGKHIPASDDCASCHVTTAWTPVLASAVHASPSASGVACFTCHNGAVATGKNANHISTTNSCDSCHTQSAWKPVPASNVQHTEVLGNCFSCHDGVKATGKLSISGKHIATTNNCDSCHTSVDWKVAAIRVDHSQVIGTCFSCHNGVLAQGQGPTHPLNTGTDCQNCHSVVNWISTGKPDHSAFLPNQCAGCHAGAGAATKKSAGHFASSDQCASCHTTTSFKPAVFDHADPGATGKCVVCHSGSKPPALGKINAPVAHLKTSDECQNCHNNYTTWVTNVKIHTTGDTVVDAATCISCHDGAHPPAIGKSATHFKTSTDCVSCHTTANWTVATGKFSHSDPVSVGIACLTCHDGSPSHAPAIGKNATHLPTSNICGDCHSTVAWKPAAFDHSTVVPGTCFTCHNGTRATGKNATHFATNNTCDNCHTTNLWKPAKSPFDHTSATTVSNCYSCHNGTQLPAVGKGPTHISTTTACGTCHSTAKWTITPLKIDHTQVVGTCFSCHNGTKSSGKSAVHIASSTACDTCHLTTNWLVAATAVDHTQVTGACFSCHSGTKKTPSRTITGKSAAHFATNNTCENCHKTNVWVPSVKPFDHTSATSPTNCFSCHNGTKPPAVGKNATHITTTNVCGSCHTTSVWKPVAPTAVDHTQVVGTCFSCHNGTKATGKSGTHITTSTTCDACHTTINWTATLVDHTQVTGACSTCHNGTKATGKLSISGKHFNTTNTCDACHGTKDTKTKQATAWLVTKTAFDHSQAIGTCASCHTVGAVPVGDVKSAGHFVTTQPCQVCHNTTLWTTLLPYSHASPAYINHFFGTTAATCLTCHKQNNEKITYKSPGLFPDCASCHSDVYKPDPHNKYGNVRYTFTELRDCTGACHIYTDQTLTKIQTNRATNTKHRPTSKAWN